MALKLKLDNDGRVVLKEGRAVYVDDADGQELAFDPEQMRSKISELNTESKTHRLKAKDLEEKLAQFGDTDPSQISAFRKTLEEYGGLEGLAELKKKGSVDVEAIKKAMGEAYTAKEKAIIDGFTGQLSEIKGQLETKDSQIYKLMVSGELARSKYVSDKLILTPDIVEAVFGKHFKIEDGQVVAYLGDNKILSREKPGDPASIDEALQAIVEQYPMKDRILRAPGGGAGSGGNGGGGGGFGTIRSRKDFKTDSDKTKFISENGLQAFKDLPAE